MPAIISSHFNIIFGNWGTPAQMQNLRGAKGLLHQNINRQISKCPCIVVTLAEATATVASDLQHGYYDALELEPNELDDRPSYEHFVHRSRGDNEDDTGVLIACRTDNTLGLDLLWDEVHLDRMYKERGHTKPAVTKTMVCEVLFKQNVGHLGTKIPICVSHMNNHTAKGEWPEVKAEYFTKMAAYISRFGIKFLAGDFNMAMLEVVEALRSRGIRIDCAAWYPWYHRTVAPPAEGGPLGIDSCAIFYIGGDASVKVHWGLSEIDRLEAAVAEGADGTVLDVYEGTAWPGQPWKCYTPKGRTLRQHLESFLRPSITQEELTRIERVNCYCPYLRIKQKNMAIEYWLYQGRRHNGAHYPLVVQTDNARARSEHKENERNRHHAQRRRYARESRPQSRNKGRSRGTKAAQPSAEQLVT